MEGKKKIDISKKELIVLDTTTFFSTVAKN